MNILTFNEWVNHVDIEIIESYDYNDILLETRGGKGFTYDRYKKDNKQYIPIPSFLRPKMKSAEIDIVDYLRDISPLVGHSARFNRDLTFYLDVSKHYIEKFFRVEMEDPNGKRGMINPDRHEGINVVKNNINRISDIVLGGLSKPKMLIKVRDMSGLEIIIAIKKKWENKRDKKNKYKVDVVFLSQIKGKVRFSNKDAEDTMIVKMFRNGS